MWLSSLLVKIVKLFKPNIEEINICSILCKAKLRPTAKQNQIDTPLPYLQDSNEHYF